jgi:hypothetical protein
MPCGAWRKLWVTVLRCSGRVSRRHLRATGIHGLSGPPGCTLNHRTACDVAGRRDRRGAHVLDAPPIGVSNLPCCRGSRRPRSSWARHDNGKTGSVRDTQIRVIHSRCVGQIAALNGGWTPIMVIQLTPPPTTNCVCRWCHRLWLDLPPLPWHVLPHLGHVQALLACFRARSRRVSSLLSVAIVHPSYLIVWAVTRSLQVVVGGVN